MESKVLFHPAYFGSVLQFSVLSQHQNLLLEVEDNYQKQTYRNRQYIYGANGKLLLNIPIKHSKDKNRHQKYKDVEIENQFTWQDNHWKSLQAAYRTSPFFEFYEDEIAPLYHKKFTHLMAFNLQCTKTLCACLEMELDYQTTKNYQMPNEVEDGIVDYRALIDAKRKTNFQQEKYAQVFEEKFGFIDNLSILDLLFNKGPSALSYLEEQDLTGLKL